MHVSFEGVRGAWGATGVVAIRGLDGAEADLDLARGSDLGDLSGAMAGFVDQLAGVLITSRGALQQTEEQLEQCMTAYESSNRRAQVSYQELMAP